MLSLDRSTLDILAIAGTALGTIGVVTALSAAASIGRMRRQLSVLEDSEGNPETVVGALDRQLQAVGSLHKEVTAVRADLDAARADLADSIRHVAVVRYDAFADMGGRMSFSAALLDDAGDGLVLTAINGRSETRAYAKGVKAGRSEQSLSPEEEQVIGLALGGEEALDGRRGRG